MAKLLLQAGANINYAYSGGETKTPLTLAICYGPPNLVQTLIDHGARMRASKYKLESGTTGTADPLMVAIRIGNLQAVQMMLEKTPWQNLTRNNALLVAVNTRAPENMRILELLLEGFNPESSTTAASMGRGATVALEILYHNGRSNYVKFAELLLRAGAKVNQAFGTNQVDTPLTLAIKYGPPSLVRTKIEHRAYPRAAKYEANPGSGQIVDPLSIAIKTRNLPAVEILLECNSWERLTRNNELLATINTRTRTIPIDKLAHQETLESWSLSRLLENLNPESSKLFAQMGKGAVKRARADGKKGEIS
ncbi:ankyrin repeat-containing domain protein [Phyllosticta capitalensis]